MRILILGDLHFGEHGNSPKYNNQLLDMLQWCIDEVPEVDAVVQLGDYFHHRNKVQIDTLNYAISGAKKMSDAWGRDNVYVLAGNHDLYYLERLDVSSIASIQPYVTVVDKFTTIADGKVLLTPWITDSKMWDELIDHEGSKYCFGHFELNGFKVNDAYTMEHGYSPSTLEKKFDLTISGHYHSPQEKGSIVYTGTPLPITMNEANEEHGVYVFDTVSGDLEFYEYDKVKVISVPYDQLEDAIDNIDPENTTIRVEFPDDLEDETLITEVCDILNEMNFKNTKVKYKGKKAKQLLETEISDVADVENIDQVVVNFISNSIDVAGVDSELLGYWYQRAITESKENTGE